MSVLHLFVTAVALVFANGSPFGPAELVITLDSRADVDLREEVEFPASLKAVGKEALCDPDVAQIAGYFRLAEQNKHYFFWFFEARNEPDNADFLLWTNGGPGCSSSMGLFQELGPCKVNKDSESTHLNEYSWNEVSNVLFIDQPGDTGFSYGDGDFDEKGIASDMYIFVTEFFRKYVKYQKLDFYVFGESYGGHYVPSIAYKIFEENQKPNSFKVNLKGFGIGNGLTDPAIQYKYYPQMAFNSSFAPSRVSERTFEKMLQAMPACIDLINSCNTKEHPRSKCIQALMVCNDALVSPYVSTGYNVYDMRRKCDVPPLCYDIGYITKYLNDPDVQSNLGVNKKWKECNNKVNAQMAADFERNYQWTVPPMLEAGIRVLIYVGDQDYICNWLGNEAWTKELEWSGKKGFNDAEVKTWKVAGKEAGRARTFENFTFLQVFQAGHMVPLDQPEASLDMVSTFLKGASFSD